MKVFTNIALANAVNAIAMLKIHAKHIRTGEASELIPEDRAKLIDAAADSAELGILEFFSELTGAEGTTDQLRLAVFQHLDSTQPKPPSGDCTDEHLPGRRS